MLSKLLNQPIDISKLSIIRLATDHSFLPFDCGDQDLNEFLLKDAQGHLSKLLAVTYVFEYEKKTIAFFSASNDKISASDIKSNRGFKRIFQDLMPSGKKYKSYPAVKIGRFAVHNDHQKCKFGSQMLDYIKGMFISNNRTGCQYLTVDAYNKSLSFYEKNGFKYFTDEDKDLDTRQMYFNLLELVD